MIDTQICMNKLKLELNVDFNNGILSIYYTKIL